MNAGSSYFVKIVAFFFISKSLEVIETQTGLLKALWGLMNLNDCRLRVPRWLGFSFLSKRNS